VIEAMLEGRGAHLTKLLAPFQPEGGAYGGHSEHHNLPDGLRGHE
jgi:urease accessory protein